MRRASTRFCFEHASISDPEGPKGPEQHHFVCTADAPGLLTCWSLVFSTWGQEELRGRRRYMENIEVGREGMMGKGVGKDGKGELRERY